MMRATLAGGLLSIVAALSGCGTAGTGSAGEYLVSGLDERTDLYLAPAIDTRPLTLAQLGEQNVGSAIAIDVEVYSDLVVAFARNETGGVEYTRDNIVGLWRVLDRDLVVEQIDNELENGPDGPVYVPGRSFGRIDPRGIPGNDVTDAPSFDLVDFTELVDPTLFEDARLWHELNEAHPGCA